MPPHYDYGDVKPCSDDDEDCDVSSGVDESSDINDKSDVGQNENTKRLPVGRPSDDLDIENNRFRTISNVDIQRTTATPATNTSSTVQLIPTPVTNTSSTVQLIPLKPEVEENRDLANGRDKYIGVEQDEDLDEQSQEELVTDEHLLDRRQHPSASTGFGMPSSQQFGTNLGLIVGIAAGIVVLMVILVYAVCRYV